MFSGFNSSGAVHSDGAGKQFSFVMLPAINQLVLHMYVNITAFYMFIDITISGTELVLYFGL